MRARQWAAFGCLLAVLTLGITACGGSKNVTSSGSASTGGTTLTVYSSLPLHGASAAQSAAIANGERLAYSDQGGRIGPYTIKYKSVDDSSSKAGGWDAGVTSSNARKAAQDKSTIAYLGEADSGASAISIPILNEAGILVVSPSNTMVGLTRSAGAIKGEPDKYYPSGKRNYGRVVPADHVQAAAQVSYQKSTGCTKTYILNDQGVYGVGLSKDAVKAAKAQGLEILGNDGIDPKAADYLALGQKIADAGADCVFFAGTTSGNAVQVFRDLHTAMPAAKLFGSDGVAESSFTSQLGASLEKVTYITTPTLAPKLYPKAGRSFFARYRATFHTQPEPYAIFGYEAMAVVLQAIKDAGPKGNERDAVIRSFFAIRDRKSVLGTYSIDAGGDTTLTDYGADRVKNGRLVFDQVLKAPSS